MKNHIKRLRGSIMLLTAAILWGTTFVAQSEGSKLIEPFAYNASRMFIGGIVLVPVVIFFSKFKNRLPESGRREAQKTAVRGGICCGIVLFTASSLQQIAIAYTTAGKSGFITALYIVIVPLIELIVLRKSVAKIVWLCVAMAIFGFYLLCITESLSISIGDFLTLICALFFAVHIIVVDYFTSKNTNEIMMSCIQFFVSGFLALAASLIFENPSMSDVWAAKGTILYAGILSSGVAYTFQILGQSSTDPTVATLLMSLESVFAALSGWAVLGERFTLKEASGCLLVFAAVILAQIKPNKLIKEKEYKNEEVSK